MARPPVYLPGGRVGPYILEGFYKAPSGVVTARMYCPICATVKEVARSNLARVGQSCPSCRSASKAMSKDRPADLPVVPTPNCLIAVLGERLYLFPPSFKMSQLKDRGAVWYRFDDVGTIGTLCAKPKPPSVAPKPMEGYKWFALPAHYARHLADPSAASSALNLDATVTAYMNQFTVCEGAIAHIDYHLGNNKTWDYNNLVYQYVYWTTDNPRVIAQPPYEDGEQLLAEFNAKQAALEREQAQFAEPDLDQPTAPDFSPDDSEPV